MVSSTTQFFDNEDIDDGQSMKSTHSKRKPHMEDIDNLSVSSSRDSKATSPSVSKRLSHDQAAEVNRLSVKSSLAKKLSYTRDSGDDIRIKSAVTEASEVRQREDVEG